MSFLNMFNVRHLFLFLVVWASHEAHLSRAYGKVAGGGSPEGCLGAEGEDVKIPERRHVRCVQSQQEQQDVHICLVPG